MNADRKRQKKLDPPLSDLIRVEKDFEELFLTRMNAGGRG
jgi:hypothetical protein